MKVFLHSSQILVIRRHFGFFSPLLFFDSHFTRHFGEQNLVAFFRYCLSYSLIFFFSEIRSSEIIVIDDFFEVPRPIFSIFLSTAFCMTTLTQSNEFIWIPNNLKRMGIVLNSQIRKIISIFIYAATRFFVIVYMVTV